MKKINFITKLIDKNKISLVEPSLDISESYKTKSDNALKAGKLLFPQKMLEEATSMIYYFMYNKLLSLLFRIGIKSENHAGSILLLKELFDISNDSISFAKKERIDKQYYTDFRINSEEVFSLLDSAESFIAQIDFYISKLNNKKIEILRNDLTNTYLLN